MHIWTNFVERKVNHKLVLRFIVLFSDSDCIVNLEEGWLQALLENKLLHLLLPTNNQGCPLSAKKTALGFYYQNQCSYDQF